MIDATTAAVATTTAMIAMIATTTIDATMAATVVTAMAAASAHRNRLRKATAEPQRLSRVQEPEEAGNAGLFRFERKAPMQRTNRPKAFLICLGADAGKGYEFDPICSKNSGPSAFDRLPF